MDKIPIIVWEDLPAEVLAIHVSSSMARSCLIFKDDHITANEVNNKDTINEKKVA